MLGMVLRRDVACCVKIVGILAVDGLCDMTFLTRANAYDAVVSCD